MPAAYDYWIFDSSGDPRTFYFQKSDWVYTYEPSAPVANNALMRKAVAATVPAATVPAATVPTATVPAAVPPTKSVTTTKVRKKAAPLEPRCRYDRGQVRMGRSNGTCTALPLSKDKPQTAAVPAQKAEPAPPVHENAEEAKATTLKSLLGPNPLIEHWKLRSVDDLDALEDAAMQVACTGPCHDRHQNQIPKGLKKGAGPAEKDAV